MKRAGFTLPETVVAMSLFASAAVALCQAAINARYGLMRLEQRNTPALQPGWIREDILSITDRETLEEGGDMVFPQSVRKDAPEGEAAEADASDEVQAQWEVEIYPTPLLDVHQLVVTITFEQGDNRMPPVERAYYVYRPGWYEEDDGRSRLMTEKQDAWEREQLERGW